ncbi:hypothetical protein J5Y03_10215 [Bacillus sp. RG28]|uniref:Uncharacterized protein n=1 Tax=Gottfriedia endophytica TaxID=2820819 RepID=A0A940NJY7_9BACI|nr:hypothetical protein [Gottfriedia endophytica]MBP0725562.1 hypothetical protein [Gottfriedia endophytica]
MCPNCNNTGKILIEVFHGAWEIKVCNCEQSKLARENRKKAFVEWCEKFDEVYAASKKGGSLEYGNLVRSS